MPYALLIGLGAGLVSAVVFASAMTGALLARLLLIVLTPLPLFLAGFGLGPVTAAVGGLAGAALVLAAGGTSAALVYVASQAVPAVIFTYLATLNRAVPGGSEWYPIGRIVLAAALIGGAYAMLTLYIWDMEAVRSMLRAMFEAINNDLQKIPDAPTVGPKELDELTAVALALQPAASAISTMGSLLFAMWLAGRITLASGRLSRPWPDLGAIIYPAATPLLLAVAMAAWLLPGVPGHIAGAFAGPLFFAYVLLGLAVVHFVTRGRPWRSLALWAVYITLFVFYPFAPLALALLGLAEAIWPIRRLAVPPNT